MYVPASDLKPFGDSILEIQIDVVSISAFCVNSFVLLLFIGINSCWPTHSFYELWSSYNKGMAIVPIVFHWFLFPVKMRISLEIVSGTGNETTMTEYEQASHLNH